MPIYEVQKNGKTYEVNAPNPQAAAAALARMDTAAGGKSPQTTAGTDSLDNLLALLPTVGGAVGGMVGGIPGAAMGGAAGKGYLDLAKHGSEIPGAVVDVARNAIAEPSATVTGAMQGVGQGLKDTGIEGALQALYELGGTAVTKGLGMGARAVYRGYLKPSLAKASIGKADAVIETALKEALPITKAGSQRAEQVITELRQQVETELRNTPGAVDLHQVAEKVRRFARQKYFRPGKPSADFDAAMAVADSLDKHPALGLPPGANPSRVNVSLSDANKTKRALDEAIGESNFGVERGATKTTQKVARRGVRQAIETRAPQVGPLNAREGALLDAAKAINQAVGRESNKSPLIGVNTLLSGAVGAQDYQRNGDPYQAAVKTLAMRLALTPAVMTRAAIVAAKLGQMSGAVPANVARAAIAAVSEPEQ